MDPEDPERQRPARRAEHVVDGGGARGGEGRHVERALAEADDDDPCAVEARQVADVALGHHSAGELGLAVERGAVLALGVLADGDDDVVEVLDELARAGAVPGGVPDTDVPATRGRLVAPPRPRAGGARRTLGPPRALRGSGRSARWSGAGPARRARGSC